MAFSRKEGSLAARIPFSAAALAISMALTSASAACPLSDGGTGERSAPPAAAPRFDWPVRGLIDYECWTDPGTGAITIAADDGATVRAAQSGVVAYAGALKRYGEVIMIRHAGRFVSATYGDIGDLRVKRGDPVVRGQPIAVIRTAQDFSGAGLKFELRRGAEAVDARLFMSTPEPPRTSGAGYAAAK